MRKVLSAAAIALFGLAGSVSAQATATKSVTFSVAAINEVSFGAEVISLSIATAEQASAGVQDTASWGVATNDSLMKVTGKIDVAMPTGVTLELNLAKPTTGGGTPASAGSVALTTTAADLVTGITETDQDLLDAIFTLKAAPNSGAVASTSRTVTLTITQGV